MANQVKKDTDVRKPWIALVGNPNSGKTALFNLLTGARQKVSNYPGVTVEKKYGTLRLSDKSTVQVQDMPGTYSLTPESYDERIVTEQVLEWIHGINPPAAIISVVDATNLSRNLYLTSQLLDLGIPVIIALNMMDLVNKNGQKVDVKYLKEALGAEAIVPISALEKWGLEELKTALVQVLRSPSTKPQFFPIPLNKSVEKAITPLVQAFEKHFSFSRRLAIAQALRLVTRQSVIDIYQHAALDGRGPDPKVWKQILQMRDRTVDTLDSLGYPHRILEATLRYHWLDALLETDSSSITHKDRSEKFDRVLTHPWWGPLIFVTVLYLIFQAIFSWATIPMEWISSGVDWVGTVLWNQMPSGLMRELLVKGVVSGVGSILVFLPQILILVFFLSLLEDSGYMARVAFMLDRLMTRVGLHGRSVLPLMSGYACAIPGIMSTRTIDSWKERLITILILPLMSCSARLPVYTLMIAAFIPSMKILGFIQLQSLTLVIMYFLGTATALVMAKVFSSFIKTRGKSSFVLELPPYRVPLMQSVLRQVYTRGKVFIRNAGQIILAISMVLWFLASFPRQDTAGEPVPIQQTYAGKIGQAIEPVIKPLGFDWKLGIGLLTSFAAREVVVSTLATLYSIQDREASVVNLSEALRNDTDPQTGKPRYTPLIALSLMVFYVFAAQCMATFAIVRHETRSWKWTLFMVGYLNVLAYTGSLIVYQGGRLLGWA